MKRYRKETSGQGTIIYKSPGAGGSKASFEDWKRTSSSRSQKEGEPGEGKSIFAFILKIRETTEGFNQENKE